MLTSAQERGENIQHGRGKKAGGHGSHGGEKATLLKVQANAIGIKSVLMTMSLLGFKPMLLSLAHVLAFGHFLGEQQRKDGRESKEIPNRRGCRPIGKETCTRCSCTRCSFYTLFCTRCSCTRWCSREKGWEDCMCEVLCRAVSCYFNALS